MDIGILWMTVAFVGAYLLGSIPTGLIIVRIKTGKDLRLEHSGRTGGTNAARAAGTWVGIATAVGDALKAAMAVVLARVLIHGSSWSPVIAGVIAILGHNYSIFLMERIAGRLVLRGGAGGAPTVGAAIGLWPPIALIILPAALIVLIGIGYASLATLSTAATAGVVFLVRALVGVGAWANVAYAVGAAVLLIVALRPNIRRLLDGTERMVGWRARRAQRSDEG